MDKLAIRNIMPEDNPALAKIIRDTLTEFNANKPGTVFYDDATDHLFESFQQPLAAYFIVLWDGVINGGAGIYPTDELPPGTCELVKMYLLPAMRAKGVGKMLIAKCVEEAVARGFKNLYLETMPELSTAIRLYQSSGFKYLEQPLGNSGHTGCDIWMMKEL